MRRHRLRAALGLCGVLAATIAQPAGADDLRVMISGGFRSSYDALLPAYTKATGNTATTLQGPSMGDTPDAIPNRLARGDDDDVLIMVAPALDRLIAQGLARTGSKRILALSPIGIAVRAGAPVPDISTPDRLRAALLAAKSVAYSDSASGVYVETTLFKALGIEAEMKDKAHKIPATPVGAVIAAGDAEIGFQQMAELLPIEGIRVVGPIPAAVQLVTTYAGAVATRSRHPEAAAGLVDFFARPAVATTLERMGLEPPGAAAR